MSEILQSLAIGSALLLPVVIFVIIASIAAVRRGEAALHGLEHAHETGPAGTEAAAVKKARFKLLPERDPTVLEIILLAAVLFGLTMGLLMSFSVLRQLV